MKCRPEHHRRRRIAAIARALARADVARWPSWSKIPNPHRRALVARAATFHVALQSAGYRIVTGNYGPGRGPRNPLP